MIEQPMLPKGPSSDLRVAAPWQLAWLGSMTKTVDAHVDGMGVPFVVPHEEDRKR